MHKRAELAADPAFVAHFRETRDFFDLQAWRDCKWPDPEHVGRGRPICHEEWPAASRIGRVTNDADPDTMYDPRFAAVAAKVRPAVEAALKAHAARRAAARSRS